MLGELSIYKRSYKGLGFDHAPNAAGFDFMSPQKDVQIKTTNAPEGALERMKTAVRDLIQHSPEDKKLKLHILVREENAATSQLKSSLTEYIDTFDSAIKARFDPVQIQVFELSQ